MNPALTHPQKVLFSLGLHSTSLFLVPTPAEPLMPAPFNTLTMYSAFGSICELGLCVTREICSKEKPIQSSVLI